MRPRWISFPAIAIAIVNIACSDDGGTAVDAATDAGTIDPDAGFFPDAGRLGVCPLEANATCTRASDCGTEHVKQSNCGGCYPYDRSICATAACETQDLLEPGDTHTVFFQVGVLVQSLKSLAGAVLSPVTSGGDPVGCEDVYMNRVDLANPCYNILDSRGFQAIAQTGDTYTFSFGQFPANQRVMFVVYGFAMEASAGAPIGVTCTAYDVGPPGVGPTNLTGEMMHAL